LRFDPESAGKKNTLAGLFLSRPWQFLRIPMRTKKTALSKPVPKREKSLNGQHLVICGNAFEFHSPALFPLIICDPPYGKITKEKWDVAKWGIADDERE